MQRILKTLIEDLQPDATQTYIVVPTGLQGYKAVVRLFPRYLRDESGTDLSHGEFRVLGAVARKMGTGDSFDLIKRSVLSVLSDELLHSFLAAVQEMGEKGVKIPDLKATVDGPALQIIPIAVYV